jgi:hypothetical protein
VGGGGVDPTEKTFTAHYNTPHTPHRFFLFSQSTFHSLLPAIILFPPQISWLRHDKVHGYRRVSSGKNLPSVNHVKDLLLCRAQSEPSTPLKRKYLPLFEEGNDFVFTPEIILKASRLASKSNG